MIKSIRAGLFHLFDGLSALVHVGAARNRLHELERRCLELTDRLQAQTEALAREVAERGRDREAFTGQIEDVRRQHAEVLLQLESRLREGYGEEMARIEQRLDRGLAEQRRDAAFERYYLQLGLQRQLDQLSVALIERRRSAPEISEPASLRFADPRSPRIPAHPDNHHLVAHPYTLLSVASLDSAQSLHRAIDVLLSLHRLGEENLALVLAGPRDCAVDEDYVAFLSRYAEHLGLQGAVRILPGRSSAELADDYHAADLYLRLTDVACRTDSVGREALQRALYHDRLVLAYDSGLDEDLAALLPPESRLPELAPGGIAERIRSLMSDWARRRGRLLEQRGWRASRDADPVESSAPSIRIEGPYDSTYSLALVNCAIARALSGQGDRVTLHSTDGFGDNPPRRAFLRAHPDIDRMRRMLPDRVDVTLRNLYPPRTNAMPGLDRILGPYGWEESGFPSAWIQGFNRRLTGVLCMSDYVRDVLIANGLRVPALTTGIVADDILRHEPLDPGFQLPGAYRLLHISSGFPRKGVDVLLEAFSRLPPEIALIVKTFPNPHNDVRRQLRDLGFRGVCVGPGRLKTLVGTEQGLDHAPVTRWTRDGRRVMLIDADLEPGMIAWLYSQADQLVAPSRGEGFGLPMAEAMLFDVPVVTTDVGGQRDFCTPETAWLIASSPAPAGTHFDLPGSRWAEPSAESLRARILEVMRSDSAERRLRTDRAREFIRARYNPQAVAGRIHEALRAIAKGAC